MATSLHRLHEEPTPTFRDLVVDLGHDVSALLRDEIDLAKEATRREIRMDLTLLGLCAVLGTAAAMALAASAVLALARVVEPAWAALIVGVSLVVLMTAVILVARWWQQRMAQRLLAGVRALEENPP
jgi:predicted signal transduction protein with EAL and GGDEF domain